MAKKATTKFAPRPAVIATTPVRNSPVPKPVVATTIRKEITREQIAQRAYEISQSGTGGSEMENWLRAERELRGR